MPSLTENPVIETVKDATYAAVGLNVLLLDEVAERTADTRKQLDEQLELARTHGRRAQDDFQKQADNIQEGVKSRLPFDVDALGERGWKLAEPTFDQLVKVTPKPFESMVTDTRDRVKSLLVTAPAAPAKTAAAKKPARKAPAKKRTAARKPAAKATRKAAAPKS